MATLMHELVNLYCMVNGIQDISNGGRYRNKLFKAEAEKRDLKIEYAQYIGHSVTSPKDRFIEVIRNNGLYAEINHCRTTRNSAVVSPAGGDDNGGAGGGTEKENEYKKICL